MHVWLFKISHFDFRNFVPLSTRSYELFCLFSLASGEASLFLSVVVVNRVVLTARAAQTQAVVRAVFHNISSRVVVVFVYRVETPLRHTVLRPQVAIHNDVVVQARLVRPLLHDQLLCCCLGLLPHVNQGRPALTQTICHSLVAGPLQRRLVLGLAQLRNVALTFLRSQQRLISLVYKLLVLFAVLLLAARLLPIVETVVDCAVGRSTGNQICLRLARHRNLSMLIWYSLALIHLATRFATKIAQKSYLFHSY